MENKQTKQNSTISLKRGDFIANLDWLSFSYVVTDRLYYETDDLVLTEVAGFNIEKCSGTNVFKNRFLIYNSKGYKVMTWLSDPKSKMMAKDLVLIEMSNHTLYTNEWKDLVQILYKFHNGYIHALSRVDVCADFQVFTDEDGVKHPAEWLATCLYLHKYYVKHRKEGAAFYTYGKHNYRIDSEIKQLSWSNKTSSVNLKLYNKSREIEEVSHKFYIQDMWTYNDVDVRIPVWRMEVSIKNAGQFQVKDENNNDLLSLNELIKDENITKLFKLLQKQKFEIKINDCEKNVNRNRTLELFSSKNTVGSFERRLSFSRLFTDNAKKYIRTSLACLNDNTINSRSVAIDSILPSINEVIKTYDLYEWFIDEFHISPDNLYFYLLEKYNYRAFVNTFLKADKQEINKQLKLF